jgi:hypothetical protein
MEKGKLRIGGEWGGKGVGGVGGGGGGGERGGGGPLGGLEKEGVKYTSLPECVPAMDMDKDIVNKRRACVWCTHLGSSLAQA